MNITYPTDALHEESRPALAAVAELLGGLLLREVEPRELERMRSPELCQVLGEFQIELPAADGQAEWLEERGAEYHDLFLRPEAGPLVQSLWTQGRYEGDAAVRVRQLAEAAGVEFDREQARGAAVDHLGSLLLLWARTWQTAPPVADEIVLRHLAWAENPLAQIERGPGFYAGVARATLMLVAALRDPSASSPA